jgi:putative polyhydroxyalkanoate system protein
VPDIHIERAHGLGLTQARRLAFRWAEVAENRLGMQCTYEEGRSGDLVSFSRAGCNGELKVMPDAFEFDARLGFLLGAFKERIEAEITRNLDQLLAQDDPLQAFNDALAQREAAKKMPTGKPAKGKKS